MKGISALTRATRKLARMIRRGSQLTSQVHGAWGHSDGGSLYETCAMGAAMHAEARRRGIDDRDVYGLMGGSEADPCQTMKDWFGVSQETIENIVTMNDENRHSREYIADALDSVHRHRVQKAWEARKAERAARAQLVLIPATVPERELVPV